MKNRNNLFAKSKIQKKFMVIVIILFVVGLYRKRKSNNLMRRLGIEESLEKKLNMEN